MTIESTGLLVLSAYVAGVPHRVTQGLNLALVEVNDEVVFEHEASNLHDPDAVRVIHKTTDQFLSYVPREQTPILHELWTKGIEVAGAITARTFTKWKEILIQVRLK